MRDGEGMNFDMEKTPQRADLQPADRTGGPEADRAG